MEQTVTGYIVVYKNDGHFELSRSVLLNEIEAYRSINMFEGREVVAVMPISFDYDKEKTYPCGMEVYCDAKLDGRIKCRNADGSYMTDEERAEAQAAFDKSVGSAV